MRPEHERILLAVIADERALAARLSADELALARIVGVPARSVTQNDRDSFMRAALELIAAGLLTGWAADATFEPTHLASTPRGRREVRRLRAAQIGGAA